MKKRISLGLLVVAVAGVLALRSDEVPETLAYVGNYPTSALLVTVISDNGDFLEYTIECSGSSATIEGVDDLNAPGACGSLSDDDVQDRLFKGQRAGTLCSDRSPQGGQIQFLGQVDGQRINTFVDRTDTCGQGEWDDLFQYLAIPPLDG